MIEVFVTYRRTLMPRGVSFVVPTGALFVALALLILLGAGPARADTLEVNSTNDPGNGNCSSSACTLREAIAEANANGEADTITFASGLGDTITLSRGELEIQNDGPGHDLTMEGPGADQLSVSGNNQSTVFVVAEGSGATIEDLTITEGESETSGGGILNEGTLTISESLVSGNSAANNAGGILSFNGALTVDDSTISGNSTDASDGQGGGIFTYIDESGGLTINGSTISGNSAGTGGGVVSFTPGVTGSNPEPLERSTITNSTISGNSAAGNGGGGVYNLLGLTVIENTTITDNSAPDGAGAGVASSGQNGVSTEVGSSIVAANEQLNGSAGSDVDHDDSGGGANTFASGGYNVIGDGNATGAFTDPGDMTNVGNPGFGPLADNGGPTLTHALLSGSPALDNVAKSQCPPPSTDQRGASRPQGASCDSGSYELANATGPERECTIEGTPSADVLRGTLGRDVICTRGGKDAIYASDGNDLIRSGAGRDTVYADGGNDEVNAGGGDDVVYGDAGEDRLSGQRGDDTLYGGPQRDNLLGGPGRDRLFGTGDDVERQ